MPGADRDEVLGPWLEAAPEPAPPPETRLLRSALEGVKVLDLCIILAGPTCGRTLAEFGADVVKIDDPNRAGGVRMHNDVNRGKQSMLLDLKTEEGRELFWKLAEEADVVVQNLRGGRIEVLGLDYEELKTRNPNVIYASLNAYGHEGPWEERPGWEQLAQAAAGMQARFGIDRPYRQAFPINDYGTGLMGAYGVALALLHRQRSGEGQHVKAALAYTACTLQSPFFQDLRGQGLGRAARPGRARLESRCSISTAPATAGSSWAQRPICCPRSARSGASRAPPGWRAMRSRHSSRSASRSARRTSGRSCSRQSARARSRCAACAS